MQKNKVNIIGAGFSGLTVAYYLKKNGFDVCVYDKANTVGGLIQKKECSYGFFESAANGIMGQQHIIDFLKELDIQFRPSSNLAKKRFIFRNKLKRWPLNFLESLHFLYKVIINFLVFKKHKTSAYSESVGEWAQKHLTSASVKYLISPALQGIYAGDINQLSSFLILKPLFTQRSAQTKSRYPLVSGKESFYDILEQIYQKLQLQGVQFELNHQSTSEIIQKSIQKKEFCVVCTSGKAALEILQPFEKDLKSSVDFLKRLEFVSITTVTAFFKQKPQSSVVGFGALFPQIKTLHSQEIKALGVLMNDVIFDRSRDVHSETWIYGGSYNQNSAQMTDTEVKYDILKARKMAFDSDEEMLDMQVTRWSNVLPHFTLEHESHLKQLQQNEYVILHGNYLNVIGVSKIIVESRKIADSLKNKIIDHVLTGEL